jgi:hypothetical protein
MTTPDPWAVDRCGRGRPHQPHDIDLGRFGKSHCAGLTEDQLRQHIRQLSGVETPDPTPPQCGDTDPHDPHPVRRPGWPDGWCGGIEEPEPDSVTIWQPVTYERQPDGTWLAEAATADAGQLEGMRAYERLRDDRTRTEWAAALRYGADQLTDPCTGALSDWAARIESGQLSPWRETPQRPGEPAELAAAATAAPDAPQDTPDARGGAQAGDDEPTRADVARLMACQRTRADIPDGYVCSVCGWGDLAHPDARDQPLPTSVLRVLDVARAVADAWAGDDADEVERTESELAAVMDAYDADNPPDTPGTVDGTSAQASGQIGADSQADTGGGFFEPDEPPGAVAERFDAAPHGLTGGRASGVVLVDGATGTTGTAGGDGPGWDRRPYDRLAGALPDEFREWVEALLADRGRLAAGIERRDKARRRWLDMYHRYYDEVTADRDRLASDVTEVLRQCGEVFRERDAARAERNQAVRDVHAVNQALRAATAELATARRDAAADALTWFTATALCPDDLRQAVRDCAIAVRCGELTIPTTGEES